MKGSFFYVWDIIIIKAKKTGGTVKMTNERVYLKGKTLKKLLAKNNLTQNDLAEMLDIDRSDMSRLVTNKKPATRIMLECMVLKNIIQLDIIYFFLLSLQLNECII